MNIFRDIVTGKKAFLSYKYFDVYVLFCCIVIISFFRLHMIHEPLERDIGTYAVYGHELFKGQPLYTFMFDQKPPGPYVTYGLFELLFGYGKEYIAYMNIIFSIVSLIIIYFIGREVNRYAAIISSISWALISGNVPLQANQPNVEVFMNTFLLIGLLFFFYLMKKNARFFALAAGFSWGISTLYKHYTIIPVLLLLITYFIFSKNKYFTKILYIAYITFIIVIIWSFMTLYFFSTNHLDSFILALFKFNVNYSSATSNFEEAGNVFTNILYGFRPDMAFTQKFFSFVPLILFALVGMFLGVIKKSMHWIILAIYSFSVALMVSAPGKWYPHYYQLWLPVFAIGAGWAMSENLRQVNNKFINICLIICFISIAGTQLRFLLWTPESISKIKYGKYFVETKILSKKIDTILMENETFYQYGSDPILYFYTKKRLSTGITFDTHLNFGYVSSTLTDRIIEQLSRNKPELIIIEVPNLKLTSLQEKQSKNAYHSYVGQFIREHYRPSLTLGEGFWFKKGGRLDQTYL